VVDALIVTTMVVGLAATGIVLLAARDARNRRHRETAHPVADHIQTIHEDAVFMVRELQRFLARRTAQHRPSDAWIPPVLDFYRRLETLTSSANPSACESLRLAKETSCYLRQHPIKGIFQGPVLTQLCVGQLAIRLATILGKRNAA
jgi:hypothetical protein